MSADLMLAGLLFHGGQDVHYLRRRTFHIVQCLGGADKVFGVEGFQCLAAGFVYPFGPKVLRRLTSECAMIGTAFDARMKLAMLFAFPGRRIAGQFLSKSIEP